MMRTVLPALAQAVAMSSSPEGLTENAKLQFQVCLSYGFGII